MVKTLSEFWNEVASICYDSSDYGTVSYTHLTLPTTSSV